MQNPVFVEAEVRTLIHENSSETDVIIYTDDSVVRIVQSSWGFTAQVGGRQCMKIVELFVTLQAA
jgi:hypothetical protein